MKLECKLLVLFVFFKISGFSQSLGDFDGIKNTGNLYEKILNTPEFSNNVGGLAIDILLGNVSLWGNIEVEITGTYYHQNTPGKLIKLFAIGLNPDDAVYTNENRVSEAMGPVVNNIAIGELEWDVTLQQYKIPVFHLTSTGNAYTIKVRFFSHDNAASNAVSNLSLSSIYSRTSVSNNYVHFDSKIGIGTALPTEMLSINGNAIAKKFIVTQTGWSDYVFNDDYKLPPISEVESFIKQNKHLPEIPTAIEVEEKGISVGDNQALLLKKIEELTLYMIQLDKSNQKLIQDNRDLRKRVSKLENKTITKK